MKLKEKNGCGCRQTINDVIEVLEREVSGYSTEHAPERIVRLRKYIEQLNKPCCP